MYILLLTVFVDLVGFGIIFPILPFYAVHYDASPTEVTLLIATYSVFQLISGPIWGRLSDRFGRKWMLLATLFGGGLSYLWFGFAGSLAALFAARSLNGLMAGNIAVAQAYIADISEPSKRSAAMGKVGAAFGLGFVLGPVIGGLLSGSDPANPDFSLPCLAAAGMSFAACILGAILLREPMRHDVSISALPGRTSALRSVLRGRVLWLIGLMFLLTFVMSQVIAIFPLWTGAVFSWGPREIGYAYAFIGILTFAFQGLLIGPITKAIGEGRVLCLGTALFSAGLFLVPWIDDLPTLVLQMTLISIGMSLSNPTLTALVSQSAAPAHQGMTLGVATSSSGAGRIVGPPTAGLLFQDIGINWPFLVGGTVMLVLLAQSIALLRLNRAA